MQQTAITICKKLQEAGYEAFFAGGAVRDLLRGKDPQDIDIATNAKPEEIEYLFEKTYAVGKCFGVILIEENGHHFEIATFRSDSGYSDGRRPDAVYFSDKKEDSLRRDFTVNALFWDPIADVIHDFVDGQQDIKQKVLRFVGDPDERIREDFLRILRAVRFKNKLEFSYGPKLKSALKKHASLTGQVAAERVKVELEKMFLASSRVSAVSDLETFGILEVVIPELAQLRNVPDATGGRDVLEHTMRALKALKKRTPILVWGILFHDLGKAVTLVHKDRNRFPDHQYQSGIIARKICNRLRFSGNETNEICYLAENHIRFYQIPQMNRLHKLQFFDHPLFPELLELCRADALGSDGDDSLVLEIEKEYHEAHDQKLLPQFHPDLLDGKEIQEILGIQPGKRIGEIKKWLRDKQIHGEVKTREEAVRVVRGYFG